MGKKQPGDQTAIKLLLSVLVLHGHATWLVSRVRLNRPVLDRWGTDSFPFNKRLYRPPSQEGNSVSCPAEKAMDVAAVGCLEFSHAGQCIGIPPGKSSSAFMFR